MKWANAALLCLLAGSAYCQADTSKTMTVMHTFRPVPANYYSSHLGFFCRQELKMQKAHVPVSFRLGSMDYCNYLEQKGKK